MMCSPPMRLASVLLLLIAGCTKPQTPATDAAPPPSSAVSAASVSEVSTMRFETPEKAFGWVLAQDPIVLAIGEAHAQKGTEAIASSTKRFTETFLPLLKGKASDVVVELWAPDPKCRKEVAVVASAQKPVVTAQADTNQNEYVTLGTKAKEQGMTPWLLRPTCDDFTMLADAGGDVGAMLGLVRRLTETKLTQLHEKTPDKIVVAYGGAMHNDIKPDPDLAEYSFGPAMAKALGKRYVELDLIVPEYVKDTDTWKKMPWYAAFKADTETSKATIYRTGERSFTLVFPKTAK
jgi:hypothetical protein